MEDVIRIGEHFDRAVWVNPEPPGEWRWVGSRTLLFEPVGRFPMATDYKVEAPAGTEIGVEARHPRAGTVRRRVEAKTHINLEWEIQRVGRT